MNTFNQGIKLALVIVALSFNAHLFSMESSNKAALSDDDIKLLKKAGVTQKEIDGGNPYYIGFARDLRQRDSVQEDVVRSWGYELIRQNNGEIIRWRPLTRTHRDRQILRSWGLTDHDINELTIENIRDPLNDPRILRAAQAPMQPGNPSRFTLFASQLLWPTTVPSEADLLLLIPILLERDPQGINAPLRQFTLLGITVLGNHLRAARLLLAQPNIDVNARRAGQPNPLELAIERNNIEMVQTLLLHPRIVITERALELAQNNHAIAQMLQQYEREHIQEGATTAQPSIASVSGGSPLPIPVPYDFMEKDMKNFMDKYTRAIGIDPQTKRYRQGLKWVFGVVGVPAALVLMKKVYDNLMTREARPKIQK